MRKRPLRIFISYSRKDQAQAERLITNLMPMRRAGIIEFWYDGLIPVGANWRDEIEMQLRNSNIAICLVTAEFLASEFCQEQEIPILVGRRDKHGLLIVPVLVEECMWELYPWISSFQILPRSMEPLTAASKPSQAWTQVCRELYQAASKMEPLVAPVRSSERNIALPISPLSLEGVLRDLPGGDVDLFGRDQELDWLSCCQEGKHIYVVALHAFGGVGKSALIRTWLRRRFAEGKGYRFLGCSFFSQGTREQAGTSDEFIVNCLKRLGDSNPNYGPLWLRAQRLASLLDYEPTVIVLDGVEPLQHGPGSSASGRLKDGGLRELVTGIANGKGNCFCLMTTRVAFTDDFVGLATFTQRGLELLPLEAACELLRSRGLKGTAAEFGAAAIYLDRHALALQLAAEYLNTFGKSLVSEVTKITLLSEDVKSGRHAKSVMASYVSAFRRDGTETDVEMLHLLGLFDRPARWEWIQALCRPPAIPGASIALSKLGELELLECLSRLKQWNLLTDVECGKELIFEPHPLIREYFGTHFLAESEKGWRCAHERMFNYLTAVAREQREPFVQLQTSMMAIIHGCKAGRYRSAMEQVYQGLVVEGADNHPVDELGALSPLLTTLSHFYERRDWSQTIAPNAMQNEQLTKEQMALLLAHSGKFNTAAKGYAAEEVYICYNRLLPLCDDSLDPTIKYLALFGMWLYFLVRGDAGKTVASRDMISEITIKLGHDHFRAATERVLAATLFYMGDHTGTVKAADRGISLFDRRSANQRARMFLNEPSVSCQCYAAIARWNLGAPDEARQGIAEAVTGADEIGHSHTRVVPYLFSSMIHQMCGDVEMCGRYAKALVKLCEDEGFASWHQLGLVLSGWCAVRAGNPDGIEPMLQGYRVWRRTGANRFCAYLATLIVDVYFRRGAFDEAQNWLHEGEVHVHEHGEYWWQPEIERLKAQLASDIRADLKSAEVHLRNAIRKAQEQRSISIELRIHLTKVRLFEGTRGCEDLAACRDLISGGADTSDVRDARAKSEQYGKPDKPK